MANVHYTTLIPDNTVVTREYPDVMFASKQKTSGFELHDPDGDYENYITVHGTGLKYKHGYLVDGTITGVEFKDGDGNDYLSITHAKLEIEFKIDLSAISPVTFWIAPLDGNDRVVGSRESDVLTGYEGKNTLIGLNGDDTLVGSGKDKMTGDHGSDTFVFDAPKKVVITDFDAVGGGTNQDYIYYDTSDTGRPRIYQDHHDTVLEFSKGHTVTLVDVDRADFSLANDFKIPPVFEMM